MAQHWPSGENEVTRNLKSVAAFAADSPFSESQCRWWIFKAEDNGLAATGALVRIGRRIYIDADAFDRWLVAQNPGLQATAGGVQ
jgi:hypothetical protein